MEEFLRKDRNKEETFAYVVAKFSIPLRGMILSEPISLICGCVRANLILMSVLV